LSTISWKLEAELQSRLYDWHIRTSGLAPLKGDPRGLPEKKAG
jgi:hypothetical protein